MASRSLVWRSAKCEPQRSGFTLVELLVVVAIIAVLAMLLMPAAKGFIDKGKTAKCAANLKTLAVGALRYAGENNGRLPAANANDVAGPHKSWHHAALGDTNSYTDARKGPDVMYCPCMEWPQRDGSIAPPFDYSYGINVRIAGVSYTNNAQSIRLQRLAKPSQVILLADGACYDEDNGHAWQLDNRGSGTKNYISKKNHGGGANVAWADGHVTFESAGSVSNLMSPVNTTNWIP